MRKTMITVVMISVLGCLTAQTRTGQERRQVRPRLCDCVAPDCNGQYWDPDLCEWVGDCGTVKSSDWHILTPHVRKVIPEVDITISATGRYEVSVEAMFGLWVGGPPSIHGLYTEREVRVMRVPAAGPNQWAAEVHATANVDSHAYVQLGPTWLELKADDRLRFFLKYTTNEAELPVILSRVSVRKIEG